MDNSVLDLVKGTPNILGQIYTDLAQPSVKAVGQALGTVKGGETMRVKVRSV